MKKNTRVFFFLASYYICILNEGWRHTSATIVHGCVQWRPHFTFRNIWKVSKPRLLAFAKKPHCPLWSEMSLFMPFYQTIAMQLFWQLSGSCKEVIRQTSGRLLAIAISPIFPNGRKWAFLGLFIKQWLCSRLAVIRQFVRKIIRQTSGNRQKPIFPQLS